MTNTKTVADRAWDEGYEHGRKCGGGAFYDNPYAVGTDERRAWENGFFAGRSER